VRAALPSNEHLDYIASLLDDMWRIPGTKVRFGIDALIGWVPGIGDAGAAVASCIIVFASWRRGAAPVTLARMVANILLETAVGGVPVVGDVFHVFWKANRRNYRILIREKKPPRDVAGLGFPAGPRGGSRGRCRNSAGRLGLGVAVHRRRCAILGDFSHTTVDLTFEYQLFHGGDFR
jgi:hypothetical protein